MKLLSFAELNGWPLGTEPLKYMQEAMLQLQELARLGGDNYILSGCADTGSNVGPGYMVLFGEVLPFAGGIKQANIIVVEDVLNKDFFGGISKPMYLNRYATFGTGVNQVAYASLKRNTPANGIIARLDRVEKMLTPLMGYTDPANPGTTVYGSWLFWGRAADEIPAGWEPVPDAEWKGKFLVNADPADPDFEIGDGGGTKGHVVTKNNIQKFAATKAGSDTATGVGFPVNGQNNTDSTISIDIGVDTPTQINHLPPYKVVLFIRFIG